MLQHLSEFPSFLWLKNILFVHLSADGHVGSFHILAFVQDAATNMDVRISVVYPEVGLPDHAVLFLII